jgi:hypothetical protein
MTNDDCGVVPRAKKTVPNAVRPESRLAFLASPTPPLSLRAKRGNLGGSGQAWRFHSGPVAGSADLTFPLLSLSLQLRLMSGFGPDVAGTAGEAGR